MTELIHRPAGIEDLKQTTDGLMNSMFEVHGDFKYDLAGTYRILPGKKQESLVGNAL